MDFENNLAKGKKKGGFGGAYCTGEVDTNQTVNRNLKSNFHFHLTIFIIKLAPEEMMMLKMLLLLFFGLSGDERTNEIIINFQKNIKNRGREAEYLFSIPRFFFFF